jgi:hypothetical protein
MYVRLAGIQIQAFSLKYKGLLFCVTRLQVPVRKWPRSLPEDDGYLEPVSQFALLVL